MWDFPSLKARMSLRRAKKYGGLIEQKARPKLTLHIRRVPAQIRPLGPHATETSSVIPANLILNDLTPRGVALFTTEALQVDRVVELTFEEPRQFFIRARVRACNTIVIDRKIITKQVYPFRILLEFEFDASVEHEAVRRLYHEIQSELVRKAA